MTSTLRVQNDRIGLPRLLDLSSRKKETRRMRASCYISGLYRAYFTPKAAKKLTRLTVASSWSLKLCDSELSLRHLTRDLCSPNSRHARQIYWPKSIVSIYHQELKRLDSPHVYIRHEQFKCFQSDVSRVNNEAFTRPTKYVILIDVHIPRTTVLMGFRPAFVLTRALPRAIALIIFQSLHRSTIK